jgi:glutaredoxin-like YruB-family protein
LATFEAARTCYTIYDMNKSDQKVVVYSTPSCGFCHMAMEYFDKKGVTYTEKDISVDNNALNFVLEKVGQAVTPIITIDDKIIVGFDRPKIDQALHLNAA